MVLRSARASASRVLVLWPYTAKSPAAQQHWSFYLMVLSWCAVEIVRYAVEFSFAFNFKSHDFDIVAAPNGIEVQVPKPIFASPPKVNAQPPEIPVDGVITDQASVVAEIHNKLQSLALQYGMMIASDEMVLSLCTAKLTDAVRSFLATQPGVKQVPTISVKYK